MIIWNTTSFQLSFHRFSGEKKKPLPDHSLNKTKEPSIIGTTQFCYNLKVLPNTIWCKRLACKLRHHHSWQLYQVFKQSSKMFSVKTLNYPQTSFTLCLPYNLDKKNGFILLLEICTNVLVSSESTFWSSVLCHGRR